MHRTRPRLVTALASALVLTVSTLIGPAVLAPAAFAGNTRVVFFGSPGTNSTMPPGLGELVNTSVTAGGATAVDIELINVSTSTLTHVLIQGGDAAPNPLANPSFPAPSPICTASGCIQSLPNGTTYLAAYVEPASTVGVSCTQSATSLNCPVNNMKPNDVAEIRLILQPPTTAGTTVQYWLAASLKEGTSNTGSNQDTFFSYGSFNVLSPACDTGVSTFFLNGQQVQLSNVPSGGACPQVTNVSSNGSFSLGTFEFVSANKNVLYCTPGISTCGFGEMSEANVNNGVQPPGSFVTWDITWSGTDLPSGNPSGVTHFLNTYDPANPLLNVTYFPIPFKQKYQCTTKLTVNCWVTTISTKTSFEAIVQTPTNGLIRGY